MKRNTYNAVVVVSTTIIVLVILLLEFSKTPQAHSQTFPTATAVSTDTPGPGPTLPPQPPTRTPRPTLTPTPLPTLTPVVYPPFTPVAPSPVVIFPRTSSTGAIVWQQNSEANYVLVYVNGNLVDYNDNAVKGWKKVVVPNTYNPSVELHAGDAVSISEYYAVGGTVQGPFQYGPYRVPSLAPVVPTNISVTRSATYTGVYLFRWTQNSEANRIAFLVNGEQIAFLSNGYGTHTKQIPPGPPFNALIHPGDSITIHEWSVDDLGNYIDMGSYGTWIAP